MKLSLILKSFYAFLMLIFFADLLFIGLNKSDFRFITKSFLMPMMLVIYLVEAKQRNIKLDKWFAIGLVFSFLGDFFLLLKTGFIIGLGCFLLAHVFYIVSLKNKSIRKVKSWVAVLILLYLVFLITFLFPNLNEMKIPVIIYGIVISTMLYFSIKTANKLLIFGALFF